MESVLAKSSTMRTSVRDVIRILESAPVRPVMINEITIVQVMNRVVIAHLSIERAIKFLIRDADNDFEHRHDLHKHLKTLQQCRPDYATQLGEAFDATVMFYELNTNHRDLLHLQSLDKYLSVVGTDKAFEYMRYWELDQPTDDPLIGKIWLPIHSEILRATEQLFYKDDHKVRTISDRVERAVHEALFPTEPLAYSPGTEQEKSVKAYIKWVTAFPSRREAFADAVRQEFSVGDAYANQMVRAACQTLTGSDDAAVSFFVSRSQVLPHQPREPTPLVDWLGQRKELHGEVKTPGSTTLGFIDRAVDGAWHVTPAIGWGFRISALLQSQTDARCYLAQLLSMPAHATIDGITKPIRLVGEKVNPFEPNYRRIYAAVSETEERDDWTRKLTLWDDQHGIREGQTVKFELTESDPQIFMKTLECNIIKVEGPEIYVSEIDKIESQRDQNY